MAMSPWQSSPSGEQAAGLSTAENDSVSGSKPHTACNDIDVSSHGPAGGSGSGSSPHHPAKRMSPAKTPSSPPSKRTLFFMAKSPKQGATSNTTSQDTFVDVSISNSAPSILLQAPSAPLIRRPIRSSMSTRSLHESLHRGRRSSGGNAERSGMRHSVSFATVDIREYERVLGDNPSVTSGPPLSLGWRHVPEPVSIPLDDYENGKGSPRRSAEYLVPKSVRENLLREHADVSRREMVSAVRTIQKEKAARRKTVVNLSMRKTEERIEGAKRKIKKILKPASSYNSQEAKLWDEAHAVAMEKAQRLEESIRRGESVSSRQLYSVGMPYDNILPSRRNSVPRLPNHAAEVEPLAAATIEGEHDAMLESVAKYVPKSAKPSLRRISSAAGEELDEEASPKRTDRDRRSSTNRASGNIVASEKEIEDIFAKLVLDDSASGGNEQ